MAEKVKFSKDRRSSFHVASSATMRFILLAANPLALRGPHFKVVLNEFATSLVTNIAGCSLLNGPFALTHKGAYQQILRVWGSSLTWTLQREHAGQLVRGMKSFFLSRVSCLLGVKCLYLMGRMMLRVVRVVGLPTTLKQNNYTLYSGSSIYCNYPSYASFLTRITPILALLKNYYTRSKHARP